MSFFLGRVPSPTQMLNQTESLLAKAKSDHAAKTEELAAIKGHVDRLSARRDQLHEAVHGKAPATEADPPADPPKRGK